MAFADFVSFIQMKCLRNASRWLHDMEPFFALLVFGRKMQNLSQCLSLHYRSWYYPNYGKLWDMIINPFPNLRWTMLVKKSLLSAVLLLQALICTPSPTFPWFPLFSNICKIFNLPWSCVVLSPFLCWPLISCLTNCCFLHEIHGIQK